MAKRNFEFYALFSLIEFLVYKLRRTTSRDKRNSMEEK